MALERVTRQGVEVLGGGDGQARVTRQWVEALRSGTAGKTRVTHQWVEVLYGVAMVVERSVSESVGFSETVECSIIAQSVAESAGLTETVGLEAVYNRTLIEAAGVGEVASRAFIKQAGFSELLTLSDSAGFERLSFVSESIPLGEEAEVEWVGGRIDSLSLTEEAAVNVAYARLVLDGFFWADWAEEYFDTSDDTITFTDSTGVVKVIRVRSRDTLSFTDVAAGQSNRIDVSVVDNWPGLGEVAAYNVFQPKYAADALYFTETLTVSGVSYPAQAADILQRAFEIVDPVTGESSYEYYGLTETASAVVIRNAPLTASDDLELREYRTPILIRADATPAGAEDVWSPIDAAWANITPSVTDALSLTETATADGCDVASESLTFDESVACLIERVLSVVETLTLHEANTWFNPFVGVEWRYAPFVGEGDHPIDTTLPDPVAGITDPFVLYHPAGGPFVDELVLRSPEFGNRDRLQMNRISRETRGGTLVVFADPIWPKIQVQVYRFRGLTKEQTDDLLTFIETYIGQEIGLLDHEHRYWRGVITDTTEPVVHDGKHGYTVSFEFEGEPAEYPG